MKINFIILSYLRRQYPVPLGFSELLDSYLRRYDKIF